MNTKPGLVIRGLPVPPSIMLARAAANPNVIEAFGRIDFGIWPNSQKMREDLAEGQVDLCVIPTNTAAGMYNKGFDLKMLGVTLWGILHVLTGRDDCRTWRDLAGRKSAIPFKGNMPDTIFRLLAIKNGLNLEDDITVVYAANYIEARDMLLRGEVQAACLPEPVASSALHEARNTGTVITRMLDLQREWAEAFNTPARYTQAGPVLRGALAANRSDTLAVLRAAIEEALDFMRTRPSEAAELGEPLLGGASAAVIRDALETMEHKAGWFPQTRAEMESFLHRLMETEPGLVQGGIPGDGFFLNE